MTSKYTVIMWLMDTPGTPNRTKPIKAHFYSACDVNEHLKIIQKRNKNWLKIVVKKGTVVIKEWKRRNSGTFVP